MKICHVITRLIVGGAQENTLLTIKGHLEKGHEVELATGFSPGREGKLLENAQYGEFPVVEFPDMVREISPLHDLKAFFALKKYFKEKKFDCVHTHSSKAGIIGRLAARAAGVPVVVHTVHGQAFHPYQSSLKNRLFIFLERFAARFCDKIYAVAQAMIDQCVAAKVAPKEKYMVVYSGMDTAAFDRAKRDMALREKFGIPENVNTIVTVARLFAQKGYEYVIPAAKKVLKTHPDTHFLFVGDGPMYDELIAELEKENIKDNFHFAGLVPPDAVASCIAQAELLWHLSLHEGLPRAVVQALAVGIPAVGFALDGTPEVVINGETGFTTPAEDIDMVAEYTAKLLDDPEMRQRMGSAGKAKVLEQFDWRKMADILEKEYTSLLEKKTR
jgi:glycosyltransferase involved in cell wall biosynthesis